MAILRKYQTGVSDLTYNSKQPMEEVTVTAKQPAWAKLQGEYERKMPYEKFFHTEKEKYIKKRPKGLTTAMGVGADDLPESVVNSIYNDYQYNKNNYITKNLGPQKGFNPKKHGEWVEGLSGKEKEIVANSKYGENLQPSYWAKSIAGAQELGNAAIKSTGIPAIFGNPDKDVFNFKPKGLTNKEWQDIHNSKVGALETASALDIPGVVVANYLKNSNRAQPNIFSGKPMANVSAGDAAALNPFLLTGIGEMMAGKSLLSTINPGAKVLNKTVGKRAGIIGVNNLTGIENTYVPKKNIENPTVETLGDYLEMTGRTSKQKASTADNSVLKKLANLTIDSVDKNIIIPVKYRSSIKKAKKFFDDQQEYFKKPEVRAKLIEYGVNPDKLTEIKFKTGNTGSWSDNKLVQFDPREMKYVQSKGLQLDEKTILAHELGHELGFNAMNNEKMFVPNTTARSLPINKEVFETVKANKNIKSASPAHSLEYFAKNHYDYVPESYAHLREMKQNMINNGLLKSLDEPVTERQLVDFFSHEYKTGKDRVSSFIDQSKPEAIKTLSKELSNVRVLAPAAGATGLLYKNQQK
jgi:hypothetical protein